MRKQDRWGHRSFLVDFEDDYIINISDTDSKEHNDATLNYIEEVLKIKKQANEAEKLRLSGKCMGLAIASGALVMMGAIVGIKDGNPIGWFPIICYGLGTLGMLNSLGTDIEEQKLDDKVEFIEKELDKVAEARSTLEAFRS